MSAGEHLRVRPVLVASALAIVLALGGCASAEVSSDAFCDALESHRVSYQDQIAASRAWNVFPEPDETVELSSVQAMWKELAEIAPADVKEDLESIVKTWDSQTVETLDEALFSSIAEGTKSRGYLTRIDAYVKDNCAGDYTVELSQYRPDAEEPTAAPVEVEAPQDGISYSVVASLTHAAGYTATLDVSITAPAGWVGDITQAPPGFSDYHLDSETRIVVKNTTEGRDTPAGIQVDLLALYPIDTGLCVDSGVRQVDGFTSQRKEIGVITSPSGGTWCAIEIFSAADSGQGVPVAGELRIGSYSTGQSTSAAELLGLAEGDAASVALNSPSAIAAALHEEASFAPADGCLVGLQYPIGATKQYRVIDSTHVLCQ